jgi:hypothetical protein
MTLFESEINKLHISQTAKDSIIELHKVCLENAADDMPTKFIPGLPQDNSREALKAIKDTVIQASQELGDNYNTGDSVVPEFYAIIDKYRKGIEEKYGEMWGQALSAEAKKYVQRMGLQ